MADSGTLNRAATAAEPADAAHPGADSAKRRQVLDGARKVFLADGFDGASMNEIARVAGVSKGTLYVYFDSKEELFAALIREEKRGQAEQLCGFVGSEPDLKSALNGVGLRLLELLLRPNSINHFRTVLAVGAKFPSVGRAFYESGPEFGIKRLAEFLKTRVENGELVIEDTETAAIHFIEMCKAPHVMKAVLGVSSRPTDAELERHVGKAVEVFMKAYGRSDG